MDARDLRARVEAFIRSHELIQPRGAVTCLVSGGPDSTCLWHMLRELDYEVSALHVNHGLRGEESEEDARFCSEVLGAEVVTAPPAKTEAELRDLRYSYATDRLRATGHTASDQVETILYRLVSSGRVRGIKPHREDGVVRPLLPLWREETEAYCSAFGLAYRLDTSNPDTKRGVIRAEILPLLRRLHPAADENLLALADERPRLPRSLERTLLELLASREGTKVRDLGGGLRAVREYDRVSLEHGPVRFGPWTIESDEPGLEVRTWHPGDRLAGRRKKVQDVFVDAKVPRRERETWPLVVRGEEVVCVPGIVEDPRVMVTPLNADRSRSSASGGGEAGLLTPESALHLLGATKSRPAGADSGEERE
jgi:tRNA(Ile)-lysidine synthase